MRIIAIRGKNLASLRGEFNVAFDQSPLKEAGLFAITGHTGAGKSTLLDAMCLALFDKIPRLIGSANVKVGRRDEEDKLRISSNDVASIISRGTSAAYAEVDFISMDKHTYRAHWEIKRARNKISGRLQKQSVTLVNLDNNKSLGQNKSDTLELISERIGLTFEQFRRSVLLAQGDFAAFLKAKSDERSALLERITGTEIYTQLSISAYRHFQEQEQLLNQIQDKIKYDMPLENQHRQDLKIKIALLGDELSVLKQVVEQSQSLLQWYAAEEQLQQEQVLASQSLSSLIQEKTNKSALKKEFEIILSVQNLRPLLQNLDELTKKINELETQLAQKNLNVESEKNNEECLSLSVKNKHNELNNANQEYQAIKPQLLIARELDTQIKLVAEEFIESEKYLKELNTFLLELEAKKIDVDNATNELKVIEHTLVTVSEELADLQKQRQLVSLERLNEQKESIELKISHVQSAVQVYQKYFETEEKIEQHQKYHLEQQVFLAGLGKKINQKNTQHTISKASLEEAKRAYIIIQESMTHGAQSLRSLLKEEQECPVCGATEHPWADHEAILNEQYRQQTERVKLLEESVQSDLISMSHLQQKLEHGKNDLAQDINIRKEFDQTLKQLVKQWQNITQIIPDMGLQPLYDNKVIKQNDASLSTELKQMNVQLKTNKEQEKQAISVQNQIDQTQFRKDTLQHEESFLRKILSEQDVLLNSINNFLQQKNQQKNKQNKQQNFINNLQEKRQQVFSRLLFNKQLLTPEVGMDADAVEAIFIRACSELSNQYEPEKQKLETLRKNLIKVTEQCQHLDRQLDQNIQQRSNQEKQLELKLEACSVKLPELKRLLQHDELWINKQQDDFEQLKQRLIKSETLLAERDLKLSQHKNKFENFSDALKLISKEALTEQVERQVNIKKTMQEKQQENWLELKQDNEKKKRFACFQEELKMRKENWEDWGALNELIGSASGHKFRIFAQSLTLESLLAHANKHLNDFARRYQLQRVPATDLDLQIIDRDMADDVRSVQSLSGGESFLVSLALALGLASLSSTKTQVESLFIDEGFGTLDQETLDIAIASLDTLQGLGRKVGIISHVPILVERIGVRVVVEKMGGGQSRVSVEN